MELKDLIYARHSVRKFKDTDIPKEDILKILDAIRVGPSVENVQNWHFIVVKNKDFMNKLGDVINAKLAKVVSRVAEVDEKRAARFEKFIKLFVLFAIKAPVLVLIYSYTAPPAAYTEYKMINVPHEELDHLLLQNCAMQSLGAAVENGVLRAMDLGYGTCIMTGQNWAHREIENLVKEELGFEKEGWFLATMLPIGIPDGEIKFPGRKPLDEMVLFVD
ncbi:MAG: nitroreductase family protein [Pelotomaculum sp.]